MVAQRIERLLTMDRVQLGASLFETADQLRTYYAACLTTLDEATPAEWESQKTAGTTRTYIREALKRLDREGERAVPALTGPVPFALVNGMIATYDLRGRVEVLG